MIILQIKQIANRMVRVSINEDENLVVASLAQTIINDPVFRETLSETLDFLASFDKQQIQIDSDRHGDPPIR